MVHASLPISFMYDNSVISAFKLSSNKLESNLRKTCIRNWGKPYYPCLPSLFPNTDLIQTPWIKICLWMIPAEPLNFKTLLDDCFDVVGSMMFLSTETWTLSAFTASNIALVSSRWTPSGNTKKSSDWSDKNYTVNDLISKGFDYILLTRTSNKIVSKYVVNILTSSNPARSKRDLASSFVQIVEWNFGLPAIFRI